MQLFLLFLHQRLLRFIRTRNSFQSKFIAVAEVLGKLYFLVSIGVFVYNLDYIFETIAPEENALNVIHNLFFSYILFDFILRGLFQGASGFDVTPYLTLPIKKRSIVRFVCFEALFTIFNYYSVLFFITASLYFVMPVYGLFIGIAWIIAAVSIVLLSDYIVRYFKGKLSLNLIITCAAVLLSFKYFTILLDFERSYLQFILLFPLLCLLPAILVLIVGAKYFSFCNSKLYESEVDCQTPRNISKSDSANFLISYFGSSGEFLRLELKLILRNKRPRQFLAASIMILFYLYYSIIAIAQKESNQILLYGTTTVGMGVGMINYGQLMYGWEGSYFDFILTRQIAFRKYIKAKRLLLLMFCLLGLVVFSPISFFVPGFTKFLLLGFLTNAGIVLPVLILWSNYNRRSIHLMRSTMFNYEGINAAQFLGMMLIIVLIALVLLPFSILGDTDIGFIVLGVLGVASIILSNQWDIIFERVFMRYKYEIAESFKK